MEISGEDAVEEQKSSSLDLFANEIVCEDSLATCR